MLGLRCANESDEFSHGRPRLREREELGFRRGRELGAVTPVKGRFRSGDGEVSGGGCGRESGAGWVWFTCLSTLAPCLAEGNGPGFGHLLDFFSPFSPSPWFSYHFSLPDFSIDRTSNPSTAGDGRTGVTPIRGHAASAWW
ncbi:hypothetical protein Acr_11g0002440 [Actinidia rufa]|uniref:Uncharacterized protein n=1 Tax=Actinidia rufa TaxID=165716 RepID=A0A7J0FB42_9ERIC|nr:hypothetical protein Acr_11g0002180 [Actinidia rufa]GFY95938.1 hypothetical protein Acr_11g0002440 [Actinidia rufa]